MKQADQPATNEPTLPRRKWLGAAGATGALAAAATLLAKRQDPADAVAEAEPRPAPRKGGGYRETEHVLHYYQTTRV